jgi:antitoxin component YwqK of YwqJK toxin-antitoxin module
MEFKKALLLVFLALSVLPLMAQEAPKEEPKQEDQRFTIDSPASLDFNKEEEPINTPKKKKPKKKVFYGIKTKKGFTRKGFGEKVTYETFYYLKKPEKPQTFVRDIWWYDYDRREIRKTSTFDPAKGVLLHGPYKRKQGEILLEEGIFYKGTKHGRWMKYTRDSTLVDKEKYFRGWPKESVVTYYDPGERKKMKEITPIEYGEKEGYYYAFHENGTLAVSGEFKWDQKVGDWTEYYQTGKRKKIVSYPKEAFDKSMRPFIRAEWNEKGKEIYRNNKMIK